MNHFFVSNDFFETGTLFDISHAHLKLAELAILKVNSPQIPRPTSHPPPPVPQALDWSVRSPSPSDYLHVLCEREGGVHLQLPLLQQLVQHAEQVHALPSI